MVSLVRSIISLASDFGLPAVTRTLRQTWTLKFSVTETNVNWRDFLLRPCDKCGLQNFMLLGPTNRVATGQEKVRKKYISEKVREFWYGSGNFEIVQKVRKFCGTAYNVSTKKYVDTDLLFTSNMEIIPRIFQGDEAPVMFLFYWIYSWHLSSSLLMWVTKHSVHVMISNTLYWSWFPFC